MKFNFKKTYYRVFSLVLAIVMFMISLPLAALAINDTSSSAFEENIVHITEITDRREENVKHFDMGDGTYTAISYGAAVHRKDGNGEWQDINNNLSLTTVQSKEIYATSDMRTSFAKQFTPNSQLVTLAENGYSVSMGILQSASNGSINENPDNSDDDKDCHFYRQDSDGLWSHKQGNAPIQKTDESGKPIIDPETADRGRYTVFVGYYAITPWSTYQE